MRFLRRLKRLLSLSPYGAAKLIIYHAFKEARIASIIINDYLISSFIAQNEVPKGSLHRFFSSIESGSLLPWRDFLNEASTKILKHEFDLLGSGPVILDLNFDAPGFENHVHLARDKLLINCSNFSTSRLLKSLLSPGYQPINWHLDFRSGYMWQSNISSSKIRYGHIPGVDIKFPWEISRMQHLPMLAIAFSDLKSSGEILKAGKIAQEFEDQILDFISANPPRFGVNWVCTMDVAIRAVNILVAYDIFLSSNYQPSNEFQFEFKRTILTHGRHIISNLEWFESLRSNHYLANIAGLFFVAAYLPSCPETDCWLAFASNEMSKAIFEQFQPDGSNFEGSTSYHRLSAEMVVYTVVLSHRISTRLRKVAWKNSLKDLPSYTKGTLPKNYDVLADDFITSKSVARHLLKIKSFSKAITRPDGKITQIGDNDSGSFIRFRPYQSFNDSNGEGHSSLIDCIDVAFTCERFTPQTIDGYMLSRLLAKESRPIGKTSVLEGGTRLNSFEDFGLYILRSSHFWISVRCGQVGQNGNGGHAHNDQLSIELCVDKAPFFVDAGTYVYTSNPEMRNLFRSTSYHSTISADPREQNTWLPGLAGLFGMVELATSRVIKFNENQFVGEHDGFGALHRRSIQLAASSLRVEDECRDQNRAAHFSLAPGVRIEKCFDGLILASNLVRCKLKIPCGVIEIKDAWFSPGYGRKIQVKHVKVSKIPERFCWGLELIAS